METDLSVEEKATIIEAYCASRRLDNKSCSTCPLWNICSSKFLSLEDSKEINELYSIIKEEEKHMNYSFYTGKNVKIEKDNINPNHYKRNGLECIDAVKAAVQNLQGIEAFCTGNVLKYMWRWKEKNGAEDLNKAIWYIEYLIKENGGEIYE